MALDGIYMALDLSRYVADTYKFNYCLNNIYKGGTLDPF